MTKREIKGRVKNLLKIHQASSSLKIVFETLKEGGLRISLVEKPGLGRAQNWLFGHFYLGGLALLIALFHADFRLGGLIAALALVLLAIVVISGFIGAYLYRAIPKALSSVETPLLPPEIRDRIEGVNADMARVLRGKSGPFQELFSRDDFELLEEDIQKVAAEEKGAFEQMMQLRNKKRVFEEALARHTRLTSYLRFWLYIHVPVVSALLTVTLFHLFSILYY